MGKISHSGSDLPEDWDFFADPPKQISPLVSSSTTLKKHFIHATISKRILYGLIFGFLGVVLGLGFNSIVPSTFYTSENQHLIPLVVLAIVGFLIAIRTSRFSHFCTYVGKNGLASYSIMGDRNSTIKKSIFRFDNSVQLFSSHTSHYINFAYQYSNYLFEWKDTDGQTKFEIKGRYREKKEGQVLSDETDNYFFGLAAEKAWNNFIMPQIMKEINDKGSTTFTIPKSKNHGRISFVFTQNDLSINVSKKGMNFCYDDISEIFLDQGILKIEMKDISKTDKLFGKNRIWILTSESPNFSLFIELFNSLSLVKRRDLFI